MDTSKEYEKYGYCFAKGVAKFICHLAIYLFFILMAWTFLVQPVDNSDSSRWRRSGLRIHVDNKTGLQYFSTSSGGLAPRLEINGEQMRK